MPEERAAIHTNQIDNDRVRVTEARFAPGAATGWHVHAHDYTVVPMTTGQLRVVTKEKETLADLVTGQAYFRPAGVEHNVYNANPYEFVFVEIEVK